MGSNVACGGDRVSIQCWTGNCWRRELTVKVSRTDLIEANFDGMTGSGRTESLGRGRRPDGVDGRRVSVGAPAAVAGRHRRTDALGRQRRVDRRRHAVARTARIGSRIICTQT